MEVTKCIDQLGQSSWSRQNRHFTSFHWVMTWNNVRKVILMQRNMKLSSSIQEPAMVNEYYSLNWGMAHLKPSGCQEIKRKSTNHPSHSLPLLLRVQTSFESNLIPAAAASTITAGHTPRHWQHTCVIVCRLGRNMSTLACDEMSYWLCCKWTKVEGKLFVTERCNVSISVWPTGYRK